jgi:hypothetical protein
MVCARGGGFVYINQSSHYSLYSLRLYCYFHGPETTVHNRIASIGFLLIGTIIRIGRFYIFTLIIILIRFDTTIQRS